nr:polyprenyl synthetase family protein [Campylobacter sp.]
YENLPDNEKIILKNLFKKDLSEFELSWLKDKFKENDIIAKTSAIIDDYGQKAIEAVSNSDLIEIVQSMINRDF